ncbi:MAG: hypothetical protein CHACPFDD_00628 [Phycisphaerae bacterium]|nr:hypothetical protein [Phycisphaerae bacterium]
MPVFATAVLFVPLMLAQEEPVGVGPAPSPVAIAWEFEFKFLDPRRIDVQSPSGEVETYWYVVYSVTNTDRRAQRFFPLFEIVTEKLERFESDMGISPLVFEAIRERHRTTHPRLVHPNEAIGALLSGDDHTRESVAIWRQIPLNVNRFDLFVAGLSGETRAIANRAYDPSKPPTVIGPGKPPPEGPANLKEFTLRKTLRVPYTLSGSTLTRETLEPRRGTLQWVMR